MTSYTFEAYSAERLLAQGNPFPEQRDQLAMGALGLSGEAGEVVELVKKHLFHGKPFDREKLVKEIGDVIWYCNWLAHVIGSSLEEVARVNNEKLRQRYPNGFSVEAAAARSSDNG